MDKKTREYTTIQLLDGLTADGIDELLKEGINKIKIKLSGNDMTNEDYNNLNFKWKLLKVKIRDLMFQVALHLNKNQKNFYSIINGKNIEFYSENSKAAILKYSIDYLKVEGKIEKFCVDFNYGDQLIIKE
jgi:hypothetical protein